MLVARSRVLALPNMCKALGPISSTTKQQQQKTLNSGLEWLKLIDTGQTYFMFLLFIF
jgi:hypothetical protein